MRRLEHLCVQYLEAAINHKNVLVALQNASDLKLDFIKVKYLLLLLLFKIYAQLKNDKMIITEIYIIFQEFCLKFIVKENNYNKIVMSKEFETIAQPLMVDIIRRRQMPAVRSLMEPQFDTVGNFTCSLFMVLEERE